MGNARENQFSVIPWSPTTSCVCSVFRWSSVAATGLLRYYRLRSCVSQSGLPSSVLVFVLSIGTLIAMVVAGFAGWYSTNQALEPLEAVTETATQITRADDLSRRIMYQGPPEDEVGQLIHAFNQTLERLENLFNTQRRFLADVGHELRTPLTVIKGNVDLMRRMNCTDDESMDSINNEVDRLTRMVGDLLLLAQAESGNMPLASKMVELDTLMLEVLQQMRVLAKDRLVLKIEEIDQVLVCGDEDRLKQVLVNLIGNAIKYTPAGGEIVLGLAKVENRARLTVSDYWTGHSGRRPAAYLRAVLPWRKIPHALQGWKRLWPGVVDRLLDCPEPWGTDRGC